MSPAQPPCVSLVSEQIPGPDSATISLPSVYGEAAEAGSEPGAETARTQGPGEEDHGANQSRGLGEHLFWKKNI